MSFEEDLQARVAEVSEWLRGRSMHPFDTDNEHATHLAKRYVEDVSNLLREGPGDTE